MTGAWGPAGTRRKPVDVNDMILLSIDDHVIERPTCSTGTCPPA